MLIAALRVRLGDPGAQSFRMMGEDLQLLTIDELRAAAAAQEATIPAVLRDELLGEERALAAEAYGWLCRYNRSLHARVAGYLELGRRSAFRYPWPIVAVLGIVQVMIGLDRARLYGLVGRARAGSATRSSSGSATRPRTSSAAPTAASSPTRCPPCCARCAPRRCAARARPRSPTR